MINRNLISTVLRLLKLLLFSKIMRNHKKNELLFMIVYNIGFTYEKSIFNLHFVCLCIINFKAQYAKTNVNFIFLELYKYLMKKTIK